MSAQTFTTTNAPFPNRFRVVLTKLYFAVLFSVVSPLYYINRWHFKRKVKRNPFYSSWLVRMMEKHPLLYELAMAFINFPMFDRIYKVLPPLEGSVLQVGCGTGLLNRFLHRQQNISFTNLDPNLRALQRGYALSRFETYTEGFIDKAVPLPSATYDVVLFARSFHHVRNHKRAFRECARLLRAGGSIIILDPVVLETKDNNSMPAGYMGNSSIDGVIWRFSEASLVSHIQASLPMDLTLEAIHVDRQTHVSNYNFFVPQTDVVAIIRRR